MLSQNIPIRNRSIFPMSDTIFQYSILVVTNDSSHKMWTIMHRIQTKAKDVNWVVYNVSLIWTLQMKSLHSQEIFFDLTKPTGNAPSLIIEYSKLKQEIILNIKSCTLHACHSKITNILHCPILISNTFSAFTFVGHFSIQFMISNF